MGQLLRVYGSVWLGLRDAPLLAWPLVLTAALVGYWRRRSPLRP